MSTDKSPIILAFSGGLDTSFCVPWLKENYSRDVVTACVDTGGIDEAAAESLEERSKALGAVEHVLINAKQEFFETVIRHLIAGNVLRGNAYPLCVGAERGLQAEKLAEIARARRATTVAHGCTAAGNDQVRFEVALRTLNPGLEVLAPVRDNSWVRDEQLAYLEKQGMPLPAQGSAYSINRGLWGVTIGGQETLTSENSIPEAAWVLSPHAFSEPRAASQHTLEFRKGIPAKLDGKSLPPVKLIEALETLAGSYGIGRGIHLGDTVLGTKGRVAFEAPAAITLITAHRELEKLVLSAQQMRIKDSVAAIYGDLVHEGKQLDLACADIEAMLVSSQRRVTGTVKFTLRPGRLFIDGVESEHSLLAATRGVYGESAGEWTPADALGYARILSLPGTLQTRAGG
ncbi:MAG: argininosuccinate synthase [Gammaproteobacteria bacterium]|nr:argininosuccinate synthase [Gammaproteobacteria bacterium]MBT8106349.1 argininosuccinate synthase [Gammaproteobacteria bacterium]NNF48739.1 argininosuccinate synthase [Woeseiaceae bacterium]NNK26364.1 argininosuccinate synthase [Woeseiaceae bacterium]NNL64497.1 argininosuccinate synthase [Woeseiaceae bacterium]